MGDYIDGFFLLASLCFLGLAIWLLVSSHSRGKDISSRVLTRGANIKGPAGTKKTVTCLSGQVINIDQQKLTSKGKTPVDLPSRAMFICSVPKNNIEDPTYDSFKNATNIFGKNSVSALKFIKDKCAGKQSCDIILPTVAEIQALPEEGASTFVCPEGGVQLISTIDCVLKK